MGKYVIFVRATTNSTANTEDTAIELDLPAGQIAKIYRIRCVCQTAALDNHFRLKIARKSATGAGTTAAGTEVKMNPLMPAPLAVSTIKSGTNTWAAGTITDTIDDAIQFNSRGTFEWVARDDEDMYVSADGGIIGVNIFNSAVSIAFAMAVYWIE